MKRSGVLRIFQVLARYPLGLYSSDGPWILCMQYANFVEEWFDDLLSSKYTTCEEKFLLVQFLSIFSKISTLGHMLLHRSCINVAIGRFPCIRKFSTTFRSETRIFGPCAKGVAICSNSSPGIDCLSVDICSIDLEVIHAYQSKCIVLKNSYKSGSIVGTLIWIQDVQHLPLEPNFIHSHVFRYLLRCNLKLDDLFKRLILTSDY